MAGLSRSQTQTFYIPTLLRNFLAETLSDDDIDALTKSNSNYLLDLLKKLLPKICKSIGDVKLKPLPKGCTLSHLNLRVRTVNCLRKLGVGDDGRGLNELTIADLLRTPSFGCKSLIDILAALENCEHGTMKSNNSGVYSEPDKKIKDVLNLEDFATISGLLTAKSKIPKALRRQRFPTLPHNVRIDESRLKMRTRKRLRAAGFIDHPERLSEQTIESLLAIPGFGKDCLLDLIKLIEPYLETRCEPNCFDSLSSEQILDEVRLLKELPYAESISVNDPRLGQLIRSISINATSIADIVDELVNGETLFFNPSRVIQNVRDLRKQIRDLSEISLEDELNSLISCFGNSKSTEIFKRRYGLDGSRNRTLEEVGREFGITRERVRQICRRILEPLECCRPFAPVLDRAIETVTKALPGNADEISTLLKENGITQTLFRLDCLKSAAILFHRPVSFSVASVEGAVLSDKEEFTYSGRKVLRFVRRVVEHWGVANIEDIVLKAKNEFRVSERLVLNLIQSQRDLRWLDNEKQWFWLTGVPRNRLKNQIRKIICVAGKIDIGELRSGVERHYRLRDIAPPRRILLEFCRQLSWCHVLGDTVISQSDLDPAKILSHAEQTMFSVLKVFGPVMQRERLEQECLMRGMSRSTFYMYLSNSPILLRFAPGVYGLRGASVPPGTLESLETKKSRAKVIIDFAWTPSGEPWIAYRISQSVLRTGTCSIPAAFCRFITGDFKLLGTDNLYYGIVTAKKDRLLGFMSLFAKNACKAGDFLKLRFNLRERVVVWIISKSELESDNHLGPLFYKESR